MRLNQSGLQVPENWKLVPLKRATRFGYGEAIAADDRDVNGTFHVFGSNGAFDRHSAPNTFGPCIIVGRKGSYGKIQFSTEPVFAVDTTFVVDQRHTDNDLRYLYFALGVLGLDELSDDTAVPGLSREKAYAALCPLPPLDTQKRIASFLDEKTAQIDALIKKKQALLDRLAEKRQAIITQAVTKGLNPAAPMKPSGIDWLGDIPAHWGVVPIRRVARSVTTGRTPPTAAGDYFTEGVVPWFTPGDFGGDLVLNSAQKSLVEEAFTEGLAIKYPVNSVLLVGIGATLGKVARSALECSSNQQINAIEIDEDNDPGFMTCFLHAFRSEVRMLASGNTLPILNQDKTKSLSVTRPPLVEQTAIVSHIAKHEADIEGVAGKVVNSIELLFEQRSALITAAVTGQIEGLR